MPTNFQSYLTKNTGLSTEQLQQLASFFTPKIASYLGITPESLSRVRKNLAKQHFKPY